MPVAPQDKTWDWKPDNKGVAFVVFFVQWHIYSVSVNFFFFLSSIWTCQYDSKMNLGTKNQTTKVWLLFVFHSVPHLVKVALNRGKVSISLQHSWLSVLHCIRCSLYTLHCIKVDWLNHLYAAAANRLFMVPHLIGGWSAYKDVRICLFHHMHAHTHACMHTHMHTHSRITGIRN